MVDELLHMAVNKFDRVAGLPLCGLLSQPDRFLTGGVSQDDIEAQRGKEGICHREELVDHQHKGHAHRLFARVAFPRVAFQKQVVGLPVKSMFLWISALRLSSAACAGLSNPTN